MRRRTLRPVGGDNMKDYLKIITLSLLLTLLSALTMGLTTLQLWLCTLIASRTGTSGWPIVNALRQLIPLSIYLRFIVRSVQRLSEWRTWLISELYYIFLAKKCSAEIRSYPSRALDDQTSPAMGARSRTTQSLCE